MTANEIMNAVQCNLTYMTENAQGVAKALYELGMFEEVMEPDDMDGTTEKKLNVYDVLRTHNTCARLICILSDTLDAMAKEIDRLDMALIQKEVKRNDTET